MKQYQVKNIQVDQLAFDVHNPRLAEFNISSTTSDNEILVLLWETMTIDEIVLSIASSGFFTNEPLIVVKEGRKNIKNVVIEGNRRLAAVKSIMHPDVLKDHNLGNISVLKEVGESTRKELEIEGIPCITVQTREEAWKYIGFKHINGPAKWGSFAKAQYIAQIHRDYKVPLEDIARQIGDTNKTVFKLYQGLMVIEQAESLKVFDRTDVKASRLYFSHLYTALGYEGVQSYIELNNSDTDRPIPEGKAQELADLLYWLYGSQKRDIEPIVKSQNPDLRYLDSVLKNRQATLALKDGKTTLITAYELSQPNQDVFEQNLVAAKRDLQKAYSYFTIGYNSTLEPLSLMHEIAELADELYGLMNNKYKEKHGPTTKRQLPGE